MTATREYQGSPENQRDLDKWLNSNAILSSIFAIGVLAMAVTAIVVPYHRGQDVAAVVPTSMSGE
jgi:hypothetical protein